MGGKNIDGYHRKTVHVNVRQMLRGPLSLFGEEKYIPSGNSDANVLGLFDGFNEHEDRASTCCPLKA